MSERGEEAVRSGEAVMAEAKPDRAAVEAAGKWREHTYGPPNYLLEYSGNVDAERLDEMLAEYIVPLVKCLRMVVEWEYEYRTLNNLSGAPHWVEPALDAVRGKK